MNIYFYILCDMVCRKTTYTTMPLTLARSSAGHLLKIAISQTLIRPTALCTDAPIHMHTQLSRTSMCSAWGERSKAAARLFCQQLIS